LAFTRLGDKHVDIFTMRSDGSQIVRLTPGPAWESDQTWSPDGKRIVFVGDGGDLFTIHPDGTHLRRLAATSKVEQGPSWSPDGRQIVYGVEQVNDESQEEFHVLFTMRADGTHRVRIRPDDESAARFPDWGPA
jgi:TolB protein